jgi:hypothetical protein
LQLCTALITNNPLPDETISGLMLPPKNDQNQPFKPHYSRLKHMQVKLRP